MASGWLSARWCLVRPSTSNLKSHSISAETLRMFEPFDGLDDEHRGNIASLLKLRNVNKGQYVISESQASDEVYFLYSGVVHACAFSLNGKQVQFESLTPGMMFGELSAIDGKERSSNCIAATNVKLLVLSSVVFHQLIDDYKPVRDVVIARLAFLVRLHMRKLYELSAFPVSQRVRFEILRIASRVATSAETNIATAAEVGADAGADAGGDVGGDVSPCISANRTSGISTVRPNDKQIVSDDIILKSVPTHQEIASRIGTHREAVTRELKSLESAGAITWRPGQYVIHDVTELTSSIRE